jgi:hypothetical protein
MAMSREDLQIIVETAVRAALSAKAENDGKGVEKSGRLDERYFRRMDKYNGGTGWKEFSFQFRTAAGAASDKIRVALDEIVKGGKDPGWNDIFLEWTDPEMKKAAAELYAMLSSLLTGEAMTVMRGIPNGDGFLAWSRLFNRYDPRTPAKSLMAMMVVMQPRKVKDVRELPGAVEDWEVKVKNLEVEHNIKLDGGIKVALLTSMLPSDLQDYVFQWTDGKQEFPEMKDRILSLAINRASMARPAPMEVDRVQAADWSEGHYGEEQDWAEEWTEKDEADIEIGYVGESCRRCGGMGHYARECPTPKGKGKGDGGKGGGKAKGKGKYGGKSGESGWKGGGKGPGKGKGKSFGGECWTCGERGHRSNECTGGKSAMEIGSVEEECNVGGVWAIAQVRVKEEYEWEVAGSRRTRRKARVNEVHGKEVSLGANIFTGKEVSLGANIFTGKEVSLGANIFTGKEVSLGANIFTGTEVSLGANIFTEKDARSICAVTEETPWRPVGAGEITIDSAAEESVCPKAWGEAYPMRQPSKWLRFVNASGGQMGHYGEKTATFRAGDAAAVMSLGFQVSDVQKPLAAVWRIAEKGNLVQFGPRKEDNYIQNVATGKRIQMIRKAGSYVVEAAYVAKEPGFARQARK